MVDCVDRLLRFLSATNLPFGGKIVVFAGDFRQTAPVVKKGSREQIISTSVKNCAFWNNVEPLRLLINERAMRRGNGPDNLRFMDYIMAVGSNDRAISVDNGAPDQVRVPAEYVFDSNIDNPLEGFIRWCYPQISDANFEAPNDSAILTPKNDDADLINSMALNIVNGLLLNF
jgi:hypothetical protein